MTRSLSFLLLLAAALHAQPDDFPIVADDLEVSLFASEPLVRNPCAITFDAKGRLCVGMGPQYRSPTPETPGDSVWILVDEDGDGTADSRTQFATGFNAIQGLAWRGRDLYVANAPDLTIVRDLDGDDRADEYVRLYTDLGNLEHGLHGLQVGPDGRLYMSKGNSKGLTRPPDRLAPKPFRDLWGVEAPGAPDFPEPIVFTEDTYRKNYHDPADDWGLSGGILRCDPDGSHLEIVARGFRNPWDICFDDRFDWLGTDNDQTMGDKLFAPFYGAHFGWGHSWSYDWKGDEHLPSAPSAGPLFEGSGTGVVYCGLPHYPDKYRGVFLVNDWLRREVYLYRPKWNGAWMQPDRESLEVFAHAGGGRSMASSSGRRFDPVDVELGPDGAIYFSSWGRQYGLAEENGRQVNEGRIYRIWPKTAPPQRPGRGKDTRPLAQWTIQELIDDLGSHLPAWQVNAQEELVRRGVGFLDIEPLAQPDTARFATWKLWTLGRTALEDGQHEGLLAAELADPESEFPAYQVVRVLTDRCLRRGDTGLPVDLRPLLKSTDARVRHEVVLAMRQVGEVRWVPDLLDLLTTESDRVVFYSAWGALGQLLPAPDRKALLDDERAAVRRAATLSLLEEDALSDSEIEGLTRDPDPTTAALAARRLGGKASTEIRGAALASRPPAPKAPAAVPISVVSSLEALPGRRYEEALLSPGTPAYTDRPYRITSLPEELHGLTFIRAANHDADPERGPFLKLRLRYDSTVYLADDVRGEALPTWARGKWEPTDLHLETDDTRHRLFQAEVPAGELHLGANRDGVRGRKGNYLVIIKPRLLAPPARPTTVKTVLPLIPAADPERGRALFLSSQGAACANCHRMEGIGNIFAPDLTGIGKRADAEFLVRSILEPSAEITEGFAMQIITTKDGRTPAGIVVEETGRALRIALVNGTTVTVPKAEIAKRETAPVSAMPPTFSGLLTARDVADVVSYLLAPAGERSPVGTSKASSPGGASASSGELPGKPSPFSGRQWGDRNTGFYLDCHDVRLEVRYQGVEIGSYFYRHPETKRPFWAHVKTPSGRQVTRNFPPVPGMDDTDHPTMHPGIWLGFANLEGISFWHNNQGTVVQQRFLDEPEAGDSSAAFAAENHYLTPGGETLCRETARYQLHANDDGYLITLDSRIDAEKPVRFFVKEEMGLGIRVATPLTVKHGGGTILSAAGGRNGDGTWGKVDRWWDYFGTLGGKSTGLQVMSGPANPPTWSHSRDYGVLVANPLPVDTAANRGKFHEVKPGESLHLQFGIQVHEHASRAGFDPAASYRRYLDVVGE